MRKVPLIKIDYKTSIIYYYFWLPTNILYITPSYPQSLQKIVFQVFFNIKSLDLHEHGVE